MVWFMVWINLTNLWALQRSAYGFGWLNVCFPIKKRPSHGLDRKFLEQDAGLMLQKQRTSLLF